MTFYKYNIIKYDTLLMYNILCKGKLLQTAFDDVEEDIEEKVSTT